MLPEQAHDSPTSDIELLKASAQKASILMRSLSHETRLIILCILTQCDEMSVSEIEAIVELPQAVVSQQLARLRREHMVSSRREGRVIYYRIANQDVRAVIECMHNLYCNPS